MNFLKKILIAFSLVPALVWASESVTLDRAPERTEMASLQNGAKLFVNYCLSCHAASSMRYNRLRDLNLSEDQIRENLLFTGEKVGDMMTNVMPVTEAKAWFGSVPPDSSAIARARSSGDGTGADWLYTYMRSFYKDDSRPSGWNNRVFANVGMPHVMWELQGIQAAKFQEVDDAHHPGKKVQEFVGFDVIKPGKMNKAEYDTAVADLVAYLGWMAEPTQTQRKQLGVWVLMFLGILAVLAWRLNASFWKEVK